MSAKDQKADIRTACATTNKQGEVIVDCTLTSTALVDPVHILVPPAYAVPVIFVPGVMGSNLKLVEGVPGKKPGQPVWVYDNRFGMAANWVNKTAKERQTLLNPKNTTVYDGGDVPEEIDTVGNKDVLLTQRFWGEVGAGSYQEFLVWLEGALNSETGWRLQGSFNNKDFSKKWNSFSSFSQLTEKELGHSANIHFPVYACGYNWLQSNYDSAKTLKERINFVIKQNNSKSMKCDKVILVTHSMGGLVARACSELLGASDKIAGIVHAVMPATGAAVAYKRVRCGAEGLASLVLGVNSAEVSAVFANAPGPLQLLPSHLYPPGWLKVGLGSNARFHNLFSLPKADPYEEIYAQKNKWWGLMREELINPAKDGNHLGWRNYMENLKKAKMFHAKLGNKYHQNTFTIYGSGNKDAERTWENVRWECSGAYLHDHPYTPKISMQMNQETAKETAVLFGDDGKGCVVATAGRKGYLFKISSKDSDGDGTVPHCSGKTPRDQSKQTYAMAGFEHEGAYKNPAVQEATLHSILHLASAVQVS